MNLINDLEPYTGGTEANDCANGGNGTAVGGGGQPWMLSVAWWVMRKSHSDLQNFCL